MGMAGQSQINYTRLYEQEADRIGLSTLLAAGFDPIGAPDFFGRLAKKYRYVSKPPEMLMTHPLPESRVADTRARAENMQRVNVPPSLDFALAKARVQARYVSNVSNSDFRDMRSSNDAIAQQAGQYGLAIRALDADNTELAAQLLKPLLARSPGNPFYIDVQTDILLANKAYDDALDWLRGRYIQQPTEPVITLNFANAALQAEQFGLSEKLLRDFLLQQPHHALALDLLTQVYERSGKRAAMYETRAEALAVRGNFRLAIDQLHTAHNHTDNELTHKRLNARIDQLRSLENQVKNLM
jgi:predicted Zn-dependent protease